VLYGTKALAFATSSSLIIPEKKLFGAIAFAGVLPRWLADIPGCGPV
jgi:hypothetical protein